MPQEYDHLCPWCQTEIVWDPEIGPEETCPHCYNELGQYRSIKLNVNPSGQERTFDELEDYNDEEYDAMDDYEEGVQRVLDTQEEAPECSACQSLMLLAGQQPASPGFKPYVPQNVKQAILKPTHATRVYVCPSCFKVEHVLSEQDRMGLIELLKQLGSK
ncbi:hypothetical protein [Paenibacillus rigui]|uniref:Uncharacterized protein n=1 Tax=Paenibacillus rigui TaxID=554312 RepID=A0A229UTU5_9BACL|nr:hypothetical protein [Paenibacillus rigui]OXM86691.1 hypothetical protein CF651_09615 [Paenibacillus rigui]